MPRNADYQKERGERQQDRILDCIADQAKTTKQIAAELYMSRASVAIYLKRLMDSTPRHAHIERYELPTTGRATPFYRLGNKPDAVFQPYYVRKPKQPDRKTARIMDILELLTVPHTVHEICAEITLTPSGVRRYLQELKADKRIYIKGWRHPGKRGDLAPIYALGNRPDAPKRGESRSERYKREKADKDKYERILAKRRAADRAKAAASKPNTWLGALGL